MPVVADGPGNWIGALETLTRINVVTNSILIWFMHQSYRNLFLAELAPELEDGQEGSELGTENAGWELVGFLFLIVVVEHW